MSGALIGTVWPLAPRIMGTVLGLPFTVYRPISNGPALAAANSLGKTPIWITADPKLMADKPLPQKNSRGYAGVDPSISQVGDYLVGQRWSGGPVETWFIESMDLPAPISVIRCNRVLTFKRPGEPVPGLNAYGGARDGSETVLMTSWPAYVDEGTRGQTGDTNLPSDTRMPWVRIFMPHPGFQIRVDDYATDEQPMPMAYIISDAIQTAMGWKLTAGLVQS